MKIYSLSNLLKLVATLASSYTIYKTIQIYLIRRKYRHIPGPSANGLLGFYLGNVIDMPKYLNNQKIYNDFIADWYFILI
jgi:hypothetical protein